MEAFNISAFEKFDKQWALLTAGTMEKFNTMTISWGGFGTLWGKPVATVYVRPNRYTYQFMEDSEYFTVSFYPEEHHQALVHLGTKSGRDLDKVAHVGFTAKAAENSVTFEQAEKTLLCRKIFWQDLDPDRIPAFAAERYYTKEPVHRMYIGEVVAIL